MVEWYNNYGHLYKKNKPPLTQATNWTIYMSVVYVRYEVLVHV